MKCSLMCTAAMLALLCSGVAAWGPVFHAVTTCLGLYPNMDVAACVAGTNPLTAFGVLAASCDLPDAFGFGAFNVGTQPDGLCLNLTYVHDPIFGASMIQSVAGSAPFDPTKPMDPKEALSRGFLGHIVGDLVGFSQYGGILCTPEAGGCTRDTVLYMPLWGYMAALDALLWQKYNLVSLAVFGSFMSQEGLYDFLAASSVAYNQKVPTFATFSTDAAATCGTFWSNNSAYIGNRAKFIASSPTATASNIQEILWFMPEGKSDLNTWLSAQVDCSVAAIQNITAALPTMSPLEAFSGVAAFVKEQYDAGRCN